MDPIESAIRNAERMVAEHKHPMIASILAVAHISEWIRNIKVTVIGPLFLCSYYTSPTKWDVWVSAKHPRRDYSVSFMGRTV